MVKLYQIEKKWNRRTTTDNGNAIVGSKVNVFENNKHITSFRADGTTSDGEFFEKELKPFAEKEGKYKVRFDWGRLD